MVEDDDELDNEWRVGRMETDETVDYEPSRDELRIVGRLVLVMIIVGVILCVASLARGDEPKRSPTRLFPVPTTFEVQPGEEPAKSVSAVITNDNGDPIVETTDWPLGETIVVSAAKSTHGQQAKSVIWIIQPAERAKTAVRSSDGLTYYIGTGLVPVEIKVQLICALGDEAATTSVTIRCGGGPRPPPGPGPDPKPNPQPEPVKPSKLQLIVIEDVLNRSVDTAKIVNASDTWNKYRLAGHETRFFDRTTSEPAGRKYVGEIGPQAVPVLLIRDAIKDSKLEVMPLPKSISELDAAVGKWGVK